MTKLFELIASGDTRNLDRHLRTLRDKSSVHLAKELLKQDSQGLTALHVAVKNGNLDMVKLLLSFDAPLGDAEESVVRLAEQCMNGNTSASAADIYALITTRGVWQEEAKMKKGISFSRSMQAIEDVMNQIEGAAGKDGALFMGITGEGKSTFINYAGGTNYAHKGRGVRRKLVATTEERAQVGNTTTSETLYPQVVQAGLAAALVDLPGFEDTRGMEEKICAAASVNLLTKQLNSINSLVLTCSWSSLTSRLLAFRIAAENIGAMISMNPKTADNVLMLATKPENDLSKNDVLGQLIKLAEDEDWYEKEDGWDEKHDDYDRCVQERLRSIQHQMKPQKSITKEQIGSDDGWKKYCLRLATDAILRNPDCVIVGDLTTAECRETFKQKIQALQRKAKAPTLFNFDTYNKYLSNFKLVMESIIVQFNHLLQKIETLTEKQQEASRLMSELDKEKGELEEKMADYQKQKETPFTEESFDKKIQAEEEKLAQLEEKQLATSGKRRMRETELLLKQTKLGAIDMEGETCFDNFNKSWVCANTPDQVRSHLRTVGVVQLADGRMARAVELEEEVIPGTKQSVNEDISHTCQAPISRIAPKVTGGIFNANGFSAGSKSLSGTFQSTEGVHGAVSLSIDFFCKRKDLPNTQDRVNTLQADVDRAQQALDMLDKDSVSKPELATIKKNLRKIESEKIKAVGNHEHTQKVCDMQLTQCKKELSALSEKQDKLKADTSGDVQQIKLLQLQREVNKDLLTNIQKIVTILGWNKPGFSATIKNFMDLMSGQRPATPEVKPKETPGNGGGSANPRRRVCMMAASRKKTAGRRKHKDDTSWMKPAQ